MGSLNLHLIACRLVGEAVLSAPKRRRRGQLNGESFAGGKRIDIEWYRKSSSVPESCVPSELHVKSNVPIFLSSIFFRVADRVDLFTLTVFQCDGSALVAQLGRISWQHHTQRCTARHDALEKFGVPIPVADAPTRKIDRLGGCVSNHYNFLAWIFALWIDKGPFDVDGRMG
jgi:hypothetical protein